MDEERLPPPSASIALVAELLMAGLDLVSALEAVERARSIQESGASKLERGAASLHARLSNYEAERHKTAWRELTDRVVRGHAFVGTLYALFEMPPVFEERLEQAESGARLGRYLSLIHGDDERFRERLVPDAGPSPHFFDAMLRMGLASRAARIEFARDRDSISGACLDAAGVAEAERFLPGDPETLSAEWARGVRRAQVVLRLGPSPRRPPDAAVESTHPSSDTERVVIGCNPIGSLSTDRWGLDLSFEEIDEGETHRELDWLLYG